MKITSKYLFEKKIKENSKFRRTARTEAENKTEFLDAVKKAPDGKALLTEKTKGYYRYSKKFPAAVDSEGYRLNTKPNTVRKKISIILTALLCAVAFCIGVLAVKTGIIISNITPSDIENYETDIQDEYIIPFDYDQWSDNQDKAVSHWKDNGVTGLMIDVKSTNGTLPYDLDGDLIKDILKSLKSEGFDTFGYISCLKDKAYAKTAPANCVYTNDGDGTVLQDKDGYIYINPFSEDGIDYVTEIVSSAAKLDFTYLIIDEITLPIKTGNKSPYYPGYSGNKNEINNRLVTIASTLIASAGAERVILATDIYGFYTTENVTGTRYEGKLFPIICKQRAVDLRITQQNTTGKDPLGLIEQIKTIPDVFLLDGASLAIDETPENVKLYAICDKSEDIECIRASGIYNIIVDS